MAAEPSTLAIVVTTRYQPSEFGSEPFSRAIEANVHSSVAAAAGCSAETSRTIGAYQLICLRFLVFIVVAMITLPRRLGKRFDCDYND